MALFKESNAYALADYILDFSQLSGTGNDFILIKSRTTCQVIETININVYEKLLNVFTKGGIKQFQFYSDSTSYTSDEVEFTIRNSLSVNKNMFRLTHNTRGGANSAKIIGSDDAREIFATGKNNYKEYTNLETADYPYLGFRKKLISGVEKLVIRNRTSGLNPKITWVNHPVNDSVLCAAITSNNLIAGSYPCTTFACPTMKKTKVPARKISKKK